MAPVDFTSNVPSPLGGLAPNEQIIVLACIALGALLVAIAVHIALSYAAAKTPWKYDDVVVAACKWPMIFLFPTIAIQVAWTYTTFFMNDQINGAVQRALMVAIILEVFWLVLNSIAVGFSLVEASNRWGGGDNDAKSRQMATQLTVMKRLVYVIITFLMFSAVLLSFPGAWQLGVSMLASAGATGLILGLAAKPGLENLVASLVIAFTQPITLGDEVVIDGNNGKIDEIGPQYVVIKTGDGRRLIHPLSSFTNKPFENWTKANTWKAGTVTLYLDIAVMQYLPNLREHLANFLKRPPACTKFDGQVMGVSVVDSRDNGVVCVNITASGRNSSDVGDLKTAIREEMLSYLLRRYPHVLPGIRGQPAGAAGEPSLCGKASGDGV